MDNIDQLSSLLAPILNDPEAMAGITEAAAQLGLGGMLGGLSSSDSAEPANSKENNAFQQEAQTASTSSNPLGDIGDMLGKVMPLLSSSGTQDDSARLLSALRPFLHGDRAKRLDDAERIVKLLNIMTTLKQQGIL